MLSVTRLPPFPSPWSSHIAFLPCWLCHPNRGPKWPSTPQGKKKRLGKNSHWSSSESHAPGSEPITVARGMANADWSYLGHMFTGGTRNEVYYLINLEEWWFCPLPHLPHRSPPITGRRRIDPGQARAEFILSSPSDVLRLLVHLQWFF